MTKTILNLHPVLQTVWTAAYQAVIQGEHMVLADPDVDSLPVIAELAGRAEQHAWEAVRRANGGEVPGPGGNVDDDPTRSDSLHKFAILVASAEYGDGWSDLALLSKKARVEAAKNMLVNPASSSIARVALACWKARSMCNEKSDVPTIEPTSDDMVEALAPIVAEAHYGAEWANIKEDAPRLEAVLNDDEIIARCKEEVERASEEWKGPTIAGWRAHVVDKVRFDKEMLAFVNRLRGCKS